MAMNFWRYEEACIKNEIPWLIREQGVYIGNQSAYVAKPVRNGGTTGSSVTKVWYRGLKASQLSVSCAQGHRPSSQVLFWLFPIFYSGKSIWRHNSNLIFKKSSQHFSDFRCLIDEFLFSLFHPFSSIGWILVLWTTIEVWGCILANEKDPLDPSKNRRCILTWCLCSYRATDISYFCPEIQPATCTWQLAGGYLFEHALLSIEHEVFKSGVSML